MLERLLGDDVESSGRYLAEVIYGANDGIVTTFAVVSGVAGAALNPSIVLILGAANLFADGFSMGMSNYLSRRSELDYHRSQNGPEGRQVKSLPDGKSPERTPGPPRTPGPRSGREMTRRQEVLTGRNGPIRRITWIRDGSR